MPMTTPFITGASRGLGAEIVGAAVRAGDQVVATARHPEAIGAGLEPYSNSPIGNLPKVVV